MFKLSSENSKNYQIVTEKSVKEENVDIVELRHNKTKAKIFLFMCDDENRVFNIAFRTPVENSKGIPHILEHSVLCGSQKYDVKDPFMLLAKGSLNTFLNAMTFPDKTCYPIASANIKDFHNLVDVYLDAVFYPNAVKDERIFKQEGWHYEIESKNDDLKVNGVVYNEMKGELSKPDTLLESSILKTLFRGSGYQYEYGGDPSEIINLSYDEFVEFHKKYYSASNSMIFYYGKLDYNEELSYLDREYLSKQEYVECHSEIKDATAWKPFDEEVAVYNIDSDDTKDKAYIGYTFALNEKKESVKRMAMQVLNYYLFASESAVLREKCLNAGLGKSISTLLDYSSKNGMYSIEVHNIDESKKIEFVTLVDDTIKDIVENGIDKDLINAALNITYFRAAEDEYGSTPKGLAMILAALENYLYGEDYTEPIKYKDAYDFLNNVNLDDKDNYFIELLKEVFIDNEHRCVNILKPQNGYSLEKEKTLKFILNERKSALNDNDIEDIVSACKALKEYQQSADPKEKVDAIPKLSISDIERDVDVFKYKTKNIDGIPVVYSYDNNTDVVYMHLAYDISDMTDEEIYILSLVSDVLGRIDLSNMSFQDFNKYIDMHTGGFAVSVDIFLNNTFLTFKAKATKDNMDYVFDIYEKLIKDVVFNDKKRIKILLDELKTDSYNAILSSGNTASIYRALSSIEPSSKLTDMMAIGCIGNYLFLKDLLKKYDDNSELINMTIDKVYDKILAKKPTFQYCVNEKYASDVENKLKLYINKTSNDKHAVNQTELDSLFTKVREIITFDNFKKNCKREAIVTTNDINFCASAGSFDKKDYNGRLQLLRTIFNYEYLWANLRVLGGAYGCSFVTKRDGYYGFVSYRDPNLLNTNKTYIGVSEYLKNFDETDEALELYIIGTMGGFDNPLTMHNRFSRDVAAYYNGIDNEEYNRERHDVLDCNTNDIKDLHSLFENVEDSEFCALISQSAESEATKFYDKVWKISQ